MKYSLFFRTDASILCLILFIACMLMVRFGRFVRNKYLSKDEQESRGGVNSLLGALFGLWAFILAFTFGSSATRFDAVRTMMVDESNIIRNTILRTETFPDSIRQGIRADLKDYLDARIDYYNYAAQPEKFEKAREDAENIFRSLWSKITAAATLPGLAITSANMLTSLTVMFDLAAKRDAMLMSGVPDLIMYMLFFLALAISFIGGFTSPVIKAKEWTVITGFILFATIVIYITLDLGRPLRGLIRPNIGEDRIEQLRKMF